MNAANFGDLSIDAYCRIAEVMDADVALAPRWRGPKLDRILDRRHALLQNRVVEVLVSHGWVVRTEFSFNRYGDRGSVDILAWLPAARALLIIEIKTEITSLEETLRVLDTKRRVVPTIASRELVWGARNVTTVLVMPDATAHRTLVSRHAALVSASLPGRTIAVRDWVAEPLGDLRGVWFLRDTSRAGAKWRVLASRRVRAGQSAGIARHEQPVHAQSRSRAPEKRPEVGLDLPRKPAVDRESGPGAT